MLFCFLVEGGQIDQSKVIREAHGLSDESTGIKTSLK